MTHCEAPKRQKTRGSSRTLDVVVSVERRKKEGSPTKVDGVPNGGAKTAGYQRPIVPPWQTLPYHVLRQIFAYAIHSQRRHPYHAIGTQWLVDVSCLCRDFLDPALSVLYESPTLLPSNRAHSLLRLLRSPIGTTLFDYRNKVRCLTIEVIQTLHYSCPGEGHLDLSALIRLTPRLQDLHLLQMEDGPPYRDLGDKLKWLYPEQLFSALEETGVRLRSWHWHAGMSRPTQNVRRMGEIHQLASFQGLERLSLTNYDHPRRTKKSESSKDGVSLAQSISALPNLRHLTFESCNIVDDELLPLLPRQLTGLTLINCPTVSSDNLQPYLDSHGSKLKELTLSHNLSLNLSFLPWLASACPQLEQLKMDFQYFGSHSLHPNPSPNFEVLLLSSEIPTWPSTLRTLELVHLRNWSLETAEMFLQSLVLSASNLLQLRRLVLKAILKIGWRDRANFRDLWIPKLSHVFLRKPDPPSRQLMSMNSWRAYKDNSSAATEQDSEDESQSSTGAAGFGNLPQRKRQSLAIPCQKDDRCSPPPRRSLRLRRNGLVRVHRTNCSENESEADSDDIPLKEKQRLSGSAKSAAKPEQLLPGPYLTSNSRPRPKTEPERLTLCAGVDRLASEDLTPGSHGEDLTGDSKSEAGESSGIDNPSSPGSDMEEFTQAMCDVVDVRIDNVRPMENQFMEDDFLDDEVSGDDDWNGQDPLPASENYAW